MKHIYILILVILASCENPIHQVVDANNDIIKPIIDNVKEYEVQIIYTQVDTTDNGEITLKDYTYKVDENSYFYPASTIKLPTSIFAAEYIEEQENISLDTPYVIEGDSQKHTIANDIEQIFIVSDNNAFNRLYELLGRDYVNIRFRESGLTPTKLTHRLSTEDATNEAHKSLTFFPGYTADIQTIHQKEDSSIKPLKINNIKKGKGHISDETLIKKPMDFSKKNFFPLEKQHEVMKRLIFPETFDKQDRFNISNTTRERILETMQTLPKNAGYDENYYDSYVKFFIYGDSKKPIPEHIKIYNKVGYAFGTLTETAFIEDSKNNIRFFLSATILVNKNEIFNDDIYEYDTIGIPFLAELGRAFYELEMNRKQ